MTRTLVLGAAVSGVAAARLAARLGSRVVVYDSNPATAAEALRLGFSAVGGEWDPSLLEGVDLVITSPGFGERSAPITDALERGVPVISELEFGWRKLGVPTVAVTGTNGKTTVTSMVSAMLRRSGIEAPAVGNIGTPISDLVSRPVDVAVVEASSFQLRFIDRFHPRVAVVTNVAPDHLDWHPSFVAYREAKARIVENQDEHDVAVFDADDPGAVEVASRTRGRRIPASARRVPPGGVGVDGSVVRWGDVEVDLDRLPRTDPTHLVDLAMAGAAALAAGASGDAVAEVAASFRDHPHRREVVAEVNGVLFVDDSKATNLHAALAAVRSYPSVVLIAGGLDKGVDPSPLAREGNVRFLVGIGSSGPRLAEAAGERGAVARDMDDAVRLAFAAARPGDVVLLAPGCASFDMFASYAERGDAFAQAVRAIAEEDP